MLTGASTYRSDSVLFCLQPQLDPLVITDTAQGPQLDHPQLAQLLKGWPVESIREWLPSAAPRDHFGDIYLNRIYRIILKIDDEELVSELRETISTLSGIHSAELEPIRKPTYIPNDPRYNQQWFLGQINAIQAWDYWNIDIGEIPDGSNVILASVDTGVDWDHEDLVENLWQNLGEDADGDGHTIQYSGGNWILDPGDLNGIDDDDWDGDPSSYVDDLIGWDHSGWSGDQDNNPIPKQGVSDYSTWAHGTHVAGLLAATTDNNTGIASTAFNCRIMSVKVARENQTGTPYVTEGYSGILYAGQAGYHSGAFTIINNSWGGGGYNQYEEATLAVVHDDYEAVIVAAAGNGEEDGWGEEYALHFPSSYDNVISVCPLGSNDQWHHWATYHETVDIAAPGENVQSCVINDHYSSWDGSSMASPVVASSIGLLKVFYPDWNNIQLETMILATANPAIYSINSEPYLQDRLGSGRVDVYKSLQIGLFPQIEYAGEDIFIYDDLDGELNPGETAELRFILYNHEDWGTAWEVNGELTTDSDDVIIEVGTSVFWDMAPGDASLNELDPFVIRISSVAQPDTVNLTLTISANEIDWVAYETVYEIPLIISGEPTLFGDMNGDNILDVLDVVSMAGIIIGVIEGSPEQYQIGDINSDGTMDVLDIILLVEQIIN